MEELPVFKKGDPRSKLYDHKLLNNAFGAINKLAQETLGIPSVVAGGLNYKPEGLSPVDARLARVMEVSADSATSSFVAPTGQVNVVKFEIIDAIFKETVGPQTVTKQNASGRVVYAAADPDVTLAVNDYAWIIQWSGQWWVLSGSGGGASGSGVIRFSVDSASDAIGQSATGCDFVDATVTHVGCNLTGVSVGDLVRIWDPDFCYFNIPIALLTNLRGTAQLMDNPVTDFDLYSLVDCQYEVLSAGACRWVVTGVCCVEEYDF